MKGIVFDIQRCSIGDGPGIRTNIFLKGCPLRCQWCHNPEGWMMQPQLRFNERKCVSCGECAKYCPNSCRIPFHPKACSACGLCTNHCPGRALEICGKEMEASDVIALAMRDKPFYDSSGGGITLSGGEPLMQPDFTLALCREARKNSLDICLETCGYAPFSALEPLIPYISWFLYDIKETDEERHRQFTGVSNNLILENLKELDQHDAHIILRCPIIPGCNNRKAHLAAIGRLAQSLQGVHQVHLEPYHPLGVGKRIQMGLSAQQNFPLASPEEIQSWLEIVQKETEKEVRLA